MRKLSAFTLILATLLIAGCGGGGGGGDASSPLDEALRYLPADVPFAVAIDTDTKGEQFQAAEDVAERFPFRDQLEKQLKDLVGDRAGDLQRYEEALGNEFVVGSTDARSFVNVPSGKDTNYVGAIQAADEGALADLLKRDKAEEIGEASGATLYEDDSGDPFAVEGDVLIVAGSRDELERALETREGDDSLTEDDFDAGTQGVPEDALLRVYLDVEELLRASPEAKQALKSKWVRAVRTAGVGLSFGDNELTIDLTVNTESENLTDEDLPIAPGSDSPQVLDRASDVGAGLRDPAQLLEFALATAKSVRPGEFSSFTIARRQVERQTGVDLDEDVLGQIEGDLALSIDLDGKFGARAALKDPVKFERTLAKLGKVIPGMVQGLTDQKVGYAKPKAGEDFYAVATADGARTVYGVVDGVFVISNDPEIAGTLAADRTQSVPDAKGALVVRADAEQVVQAILREVDSEDFKIGDFSIPNSGIARRIGGAIVTRPLDQLTGSIESSTEGLSGSFKVTLDD